MIDQWNAPEGVAAEHAGYLLRWEFSHLTFRERVTVVIYLIIGAAGGLGGGVALAHGIQHWFAWAFSALVLEPIGAACVIGLFALFSPDSLVASFLFTAATRASIAIRLVIIGAATFMLTLLALALTQRILER